MSRLGKALIITGSVLVAGCSTLAYFYLVGNKVRRDNRLTDRFRRHDYEWLR